VPFIEAYKGNVLDEVKMNEVATAHDRCQIDVEREPIYQLTKTIPDVPRV
jgi:hypothetical protein